MPVQRKVFRIEQRSFAEAAGDAPPADGAAMRHQEFIGEIRALRGLLEPSAVDRDAVERSRAQIVEAQAYRAELERIHDALVHSRSEMEAFAAGSSGTRALSQAGRELEAIVAHTEQATQQVLRAAEEIDQTANTLSAGVKSEYERGLAGDIRDQVMHLYEACNFQDLTGQRVAKVTALLERMEGHIGRLMQHWRAIEHFKPVVADTPAEGDARFLNGPKLSGDRGHSTQDEIDAIFRRS